MNVQFAADRLRLRIDNAAFARLRAGETLSVALDWPGVSWRIDVHLGEALGLDRDGNAIVLTFPRDDAETLAARLPARDGLQATLVLPTGPLDVRLEVDLHDGRRRAR